MQNRLGRQTPTQNVTLPYEKTRGNEALALYAKTERRAMEWQALLMYDMLAYDDDDLWVLRAATKRQE